MVIHHSRSYKDLASGVKYYKTICDEVDGDIDADGVGSEGIGVHQDVNSKVPADNGMEDPGIGGSIFTRYIGQIDVVECDKKKEQTDQDPHRCQSLQSDKEKDHAGKKDQKRLGPAYRGHRVQLGSEIA